MKTRLRIKNKTHYRTDDLRKLFKECMKREGVTKCACDVIYKRGGGWSKIRGSAWYNSHWVKMLLPKTHWVEVNGKWKQMDYEELPENYVVSVAQVFIHELGHNLGLHHDSMVYSGEINCDWAKQYQIRKRIPTLKPKRNLKQERYEKAKSKVGYYETRLKRTQNLLKKWEKKVRYYERQN